MVRIMELWVRIKMNIIVLIFCEWLIFWQSRKWMSDGHHHKM